MRMHKLSYLVVVVSVVGCTRRQGQVTHGQLRAMSDAEIRAHLDRAGVKYRHFYPARLHLGHTGISDLSPLRGLPLKHLDLYETPVSDLSPLKGMPLESLDIGLTKVRDLSPLAGMPLKSLYIRRTQVDDLSPLAGMQLTNLLMFDTDVNDLTPLKGMPLIELSMTPHRIVKGINAVREMRCLRTVDNVPADTFWKLHDAGFVAFGDPDVSAVPVRRDGRPWEGPFPDGISAKTFSYEGVLFYKDGKPWSGCKPRGGGSIDQWFLDAYSEGTIVSTMSLRQYYELLRQKENVAEPGAAGDPDEPRR